MSIDDYFVQLGSVIAACPIVQTSSVTYEKRAPFQGYVRGELDFIDGSTLHLREFVDAEDGIERLTYVYQYMDPEPSLVLRYDNTGHHRKLGLTTYPHHKHIADEDKVVESTAPTLAEVLDEIMMIVKLP